MRADRLITILLFLQSRGRMSAPELARELEVSKRTVLRDIEALGAAGVPIYSIRGPAGGFEIWDGFRTQLTGLSDDEAEALFLLGLPGPAQLLGLGEAMERSALKLLESLPPGMRDHAERARDRFLFDATPWEGDPPSELVRFLAVAIRRRRVVRFAHGGEVVECRPRALVLKGTDWLLVADARRRSVFPVAALDSPVTTGARFSADPDFDLRRFWNEWAAAPGDTWREPAPN